MKISIIILNYNTADYLEQTLRSIKPLPNQEIIVVDNASTDNSVDLVRKNFPSVKLIINQKNIGFSAGNNVGIRQAKGKHIVLLNSDTQIIDDAISTLSAYLDTHPKAGIVGPKLLLPDGAIDLASHRGFPTPWNAFTYFAKLEQIFPNHKVFSGYHQTWKDFNHTHPVDAISGAVLMIRQQVINDIGLLDENFFLYGEDLDWCKRAKDAGWEVIYHPQAVVIHHKSVSGKKKSGKSAADTRKSSRHHFFTTMKQYYEKHYQHHPKPLRFIIHSLGSVLERVKK